MGMGDLKVSERNQETANAGKDDWRDAGASGTRQSDRGAYQTNPFEKDGTNSKADTARANNTAKNAHENKFEAKATVIGDVTLKPNMVVKIENVGTKYGGLWYIRKVTHKINNEGYLCELDLARDAYGDTSGDKSDSTTPGGANANADSGYKPKRVIQVDSLNSKESKITK